ncbi:MAG: hypothetical protein J5379_05695 [Clostridiales bacterium]|nr:hypothetical protein [Clostridiales bacterium]
MNSNQIGLLLAQPYYVVDILPARVPEGSEGQYFVVEQYYLKAPKIDGLHEKFTDILLT